MSVYNEQDELMRYGNAPECCPECHESLTGRCKFHRETESSARWYEWVCQGADCGAVMVTPAPAPENQLCASCQAPAEKLHQELEQLLADDDKYQLSRGD